MCSKSSYIQAHRPRLYLIEIEVTIAPTRVWNLYFFTRSKGSDRGTDTHTSAAGVQIAMKS